MVDAHHIVHVMDALTQLPLHLRGQGFQTMHKFPYPMMIRFVLVVLVVRTPQISNAGWILIVIQESGVEELGV